MCADVALARKSYMLKDQYHGQRPKVSAGSSTNSFLIYTADDGDEFSIKFSLKLALGWEFSDDVEDNNDGNTSNYLAQFELQAVAEAYAQMLISFPRFIYIEPTFEIPEFPSGLMFQMYYFYDWETNRQNDQMCFSIYLSVDEFEPLSQYIMRFQNCYKIIINCLYDFEQWTDPDALWIDKCSQSTKSEITMWEPTALGLYEYPIFGNPYKDQLEQGVDCTPGTVNALLYPATMATPFQFHVLSYIMERFQAGKKTLNMGTQ
jgi:hypothetical protein